MDLDFDKAAKKLSARQKEQQKAKKAQLERKKKEEEARRAVKQQVEEAREERERYMAERNIQQATTRGTSPPPSASDELYDKTLVVVNGSSSSSSSSSFSSASSSSSSSSAPSGLERLQSRMEHADRIILPPSVLAALDSHPRRDELRYPLQFRLSAPNPNRQKERVKKEEKGTGDGKEIEMETGEEGEEEENGDNELVTHAGVLEFIAEEGTVVLPLHVLQALKFPSSVRVTYASLPKGRVAEFRALTDEVKDVGDLRAYLEAALRSKFSTLTEGETIRLAFGGGAGRVALKVVKLEPAGAVSIVDTELAVDVDVPKASRQRPRARGSMGETENGGGGEGEGEGEDEWGMLDVEGGSSNLRILELGVEEKGEVGKEELCEFRSEMPLESLQTLSDGLAGVLVSLHTEPADGADLYLSVPPLRDATPHRHHFFEFAAGTKEILLTVGALRAALGTHGGGGDGGERGDANMVSPSVPFGSVGVGGVVPSPPSFQWPRSLLVGVHGFAERSSFVLSARLLGVEEMTKRERENGGMMTTGHGQEQSAGQQDSSASSAVCGFCGQSVPAASLQMHELHCGRHRWKCKVCGVVLKKSEGETHTHCEVCGEGLHKDEVEKHRRLWHTPLSCPDCGRGGLPRAELGLHRRNECPKRLLLCRFCGQFEAAGDGKDLDAVDKLRGLSAHEAYCGARTAECSICGRAVMLKEMDLHMQAAHHPSAFVGASEADKDAIAVAVTEPKPRYEPCPLCGLTQFESAEDWSDHVQLCFEQQVPPEGTKEDAQMNPVDVDEEEEDELMEGGLEGVTLDKCANVPCGAPLSSVVTLPPSVSGSSPPLPLQALCPRCRPLAPSVRERRRSSSAGGSPAAGGAEEADGSSSSVDTQALFKKYFSQLVNGCGSSVCENYRCCRSAQGARGDALVDPSGAAAVALQLSGEASLSVSKSSSSSSSTAAAAGSGTRGSSGEDGRQGNTGGGGASARALRLPRLYLCLPKVL